MDIHTQAFNLARRYSMKNENDMMQEDLFEADNNASFNSTSSSNNNSVSEKYCASLLGKHMPVGLELPQECQRFGSFMSGLQRRDSTPREQDEQANVAFAGMSPHEAQEAQRSREHGRVHTAKINRRLTSRSKESESSWF